MQRAWFGLVALAFAVGLHGQTAVDARVRTGFEVIREGDLRANLTFLAGDGLEGRMSLQPGDDAAAEWVAAEFAKAGLRPVGMDADGTASYMQAIRLVEYRPDAAATRLVMTRAGGAGKEWRAPVLAGGFRANVDVTGGVVWAGYGITAPELGYDDYAGVDARGKIVVVMEHEPQEDDGKSIFNGKGNTRYATSRVKVLNAQRHGAVAVLLMPEPNATHVSASQRQANVFAGVTAKRLTPIPLQAIAGDEVAIPLMSVPLEVVDAMFEGSGATAKAMQTAIDRDLKVQSREIAGVTLHLTMRNASVREATTYNVVGLLEGSDPALKAETLIVSGHHDHKWGFGGRGAGWAAA